MDFAKTDQIFDHYVLTQENREDRYLTLGVLDGPVVVCVWTWRGDARRVISLRKAEKDEREAYYVYRP